MTDTYSLVYKWILWSSSKVFTFVLPCLWKVISIHPCVSSNYAHRLVCLSSNYPVSISITKRRHRKVKYIKNDLTAAALYAYTSSALKAHRRSKGIVPHVLTSVLQACDQLHALIALLLAITTSSTQWAGGWLSCRASLDTEKSPLSILEIKPPR